MKRLLLIFLVGCGGSPFEVLPSGPSLEPQPAASEDAGPPTVASSPLSLPTVAPDAGGPETGTEAGAEAGASELPEPHEAGAAEADASPSAPLPEASAVPEASAPIDVVCHLSIGTVSCSGAGIWTIYFKGESCDASHGPVATCPVGTPCQATNTPGGTLYQGTCE